MLMYINISAYVYMCTHVYIHIGAAMSRITPVTNLHSSTWYVQKREEVPCARLYMQLRESVQESLWASCCFRQEYVNILLCMNIYTYAYLYMHMYIYIYI